MLNQLPLTVLLKESRGGNEQAFGQLVPVVYDQLRKLASKCLLSERPGHTLHPTELVHEAYMRLVGADVDWQDRAHFYAVAARTMRRILVDYAKEQISQKRGGGSERISLEDIAVISPQTSPDVLALDEALGRLSARDPRKGQIVELLFFGGLTYEEVANVVGVSQATIHRDLQMAKAWLQNELNNSPS